MPKKKHQIEMDEETWKTVKLLSKTYGKKTSKIVENLINKNVESVSTKILKDLSDDPTKIKHLRFELTVKEYSDFWYIGSLLNVKKKKHILLKMISLIKELKQ